MKAYSLSTYIQKKQLNDSQDLMPHGFIQDYEAEDKMQYDLILKTIKQNPNSTSTQIANKARLDRYRIERQLRKMVDAGDTNVKKIKNRNYYWV